MISWLISYENHITFIFGGGNIKQPKGHPGGQLVSGVH